MGPDNEPNDDLYDICNYMCRRAFALVYAFDGVTFHFFCNEIGRLWMVTKKGMFLLIKDWLAGWRRHYEGLRLVCTLK